MEELEGIAPEHGVGSGSGRSRAGRLDPALTLRRVRPRPRKRAHTVTESVAPRTRFRDSASIRRESG